MIADLHCGHPTGLTPPEWQFRLGAGGIRDRYAQYQKESWEAYCGMIERSGPVDVLFALADLMDGRDTGRHLVTEDRSDQVLMAAQCIERWNAKEIVMVYGTRRHTGGSDKWEEDVARECGATILSRRFVTVENVTFKLRHKTGRSRVPYGRSTVPSRDAIWGELRAARGKDPHVDVYLFAHTHYFVYQGGPHWLCMTCPALQGSTEFGVEEIDDDVDFGVLWFDVEAGTFDWGSEIVTIEAGKPEVLQL